ncbi:hypothetical protein [Pelagicoccus albus]|nr:hypothetical protein [Pelagicoccus albus]
MDWRPFASLVGMKLMLRPVDEMLHVRAVFMPAKVLPLGQFAID